MLSTLSLTKNIEEVFDNNQRIGDKISGYQQVNYIYIKLLFPNGFMFHAAQ